MLNGKKYEHWVVRFAYLVGAMDALTGLLLMTIPFPILALMGLGQPNGAAEIFLRWLGVFVASVGCAYFLPGLVRSRAGRWHGLRMVLMFTALVRCAVAVFLGWAILAERLELGWILVLGCDASVGLLQAFYLWVTRPGVLSGGVYDG